MTQGFWSKEETAEPQDKVASPTPPPLQPPALQPEIEGGHMENVEVDEINEVIELTGAELLALVDEAKELAYLDATAKLSLEIEEKVRQEYANKPVYRGLLGFLAWVFGQAPDSRGRPSGSWTVYLLAHIPIIAYMAAACYAVFRGTNFKVLSVISPWIPLFPLLLSWVAWLAHHKKVAEVVVHIINAVGNAFSTAKSGVGSAFSGMSASLTVSGGKPVDTTLTPGKKVEIKPREGSKPKTDPSTLPKTPGS